MARASGPAPTTNACRADQFEATAIVLALPQADAELIRELTDLITGKPTETA